MSEFITNLFSVPVWQGHHSDEDLNKRLKDLCYQWRDKPETDGLVSDAWEQGKRSKEKEEQDENGVTTFYSDNLILRDEWSECVKFITDFCGHMLSTTHDLSDTTISLANMWATIYPQGGYVPQHIFLKDDSIVTCSFVRSVVLAATIKLVIPCLSIDGDTGSFLLRNYDLVCQ